MIRKVVILSLTVMCLVTMAAWALDLQGERFRLHFENGHASFSFPLRGYDGADRLDVRFGGFAFYEAFRSVLPPLEDADFLLLAVEPRLEAPAWSLVLLFGCYPAIAIVRGRLHRWRRRGRGLCIQCGYNLACNVSGVCPECGGRA